MALIDFHGYQDSVRWRLVPLGIEIQGVGIERTPGAPTTIRNIWERFNPGINAAAERFGVPCVLIVATIATEARIRNGQADPNSVRKEPGYTSDNETPKRISAGLMQTLLSTARDTLGNPSIDRQWLLDPNNSILAGTAYVAQQKPKTEFDPPKVAAAYNAGGIYRQESKANRWKMRQYPIGTGEHCDRFVRWFNDAVAVLDAHSVRPAIPYSILLAGQLVPPPVVPVVVKSAIVVFKPGAIVESQEGKAVVEYMRQSGVSCRVTSGKRSTLPSDHAKPGTGGIGLAVDFAGLRENLRDTQEMADIFNALAKVAPQLDELIFAGPQVKQNVKLGRWVNKYAQADHHDHVHCSVPKGRFIQWPGGSLDQEDKMQRVVRTTKQDGSDWPGRYITDDILVGYIGSGSRLADLERRFGPAQVMPRVDFDQLAKMPANPKAWPE